MSEDPMLHDPRPLKRICLSSPIDPNLNFSQSERPQIEPRLPSSSSPGFSMPVRRNGASHPMIPPSQLRITSCPCLTAPTGPTEAFEDEQTEPSLSSKPSSQVNEDRTCRSQPHPPHSEPPEMTSSAQGLVSVSGLISEPLEDFDADHEDWDELNDWKDYELADIEILDEVDAQNLQLGKPDEGDIFCNPPSISKISSLNLAPIPISRDPPQSSGHNSSRDSSSPTRSVRATLEPPTRTTSLFTTGHQQPIIFRTASSSSFGNVLPFRAPSKIANRTISSNHHPPEPRLTQDVPLLGFKTGHGRTVTPPSKHAVQNALDGLTSADFMSSSPDRSEHLPDSPTPHTRALNGPPVSTSPKRFGPKDNVQHECNKEGDYNVPRKLSFVDEEDSNLEAHSHIDETSISHPRLPPLQVIRSPRRILANVSNHHPYTRPTSPVTPRTPMANMSKFPMPAALSTHQRYRPDPTTVNPQRVASRCVGLTPQSVQLSKTVKNSGLKTFVTPFKVNLRPGLNAASAPRLNGKIDPETISTNHDSPGPNLRTTNMSRRSISSRKSVIDIAPFFAPARQSIAHWLGPPKSYTPRQLFTLGVPESIVFMTAQSAKLWHFNSLSDEPFGPIQALGELYKSGCLPSKATPEWLALNWELIIRKFSGMIRWLPSCRSRLWNPNSVVQQLKYRYEREFNYGHRSAVRLMLDNECPLGAPVCLFVSSIKSSRNFLDGKAKWKANESMTDCKLELSDGWYKINCVIDATLFKAISNGKIKVGHKLAIGSVSLRSSSLNKSNQSTVIDESSIDEPELVLEGNSTSRVRWFERLGFRIHPWFSSLRSLSCDGGKVSMMDISILRMFPCMFIDENNPYNRWGEEEEIENQAAWETSRQIEIERISQEKNEEYQTLIKTRDLINDIFLNRLEGNISPKKNEINSDLHLIEFDVDDVIEGLLDGKMNFVDLKKYSIDQLKELLDGIQSMVEGFERSGPDELQKTLNERVPLRKIRKVCTLRIKDFQTFQYTSNQRTAQLLIQDITQVEEGLLKEGQRYWVQNVQPQKNVRWDAKLERVELLLCTRRDTKWRWIRTD